MLKLGPRMCERSAGTRKGAQGTDYLSKSGLATVYKNLQKYPS